MKVLTVDLAVKDALSSVLFMRASFGSPYVDDHDELIGLSFILSICIMVVKVSVEWVVFILSIVMMSVAIYFEWYSVTSFLRVYPSPYHFILLYCFLFCV